MKKITKITGLLSAAAIMTFAFTSDSQAVPTFARQTGFSCQTCHFNTFPTLNSFGRAFKASGFTTMGGSQGLIEGEGLSIPETLNASLITKLRYQKSTTKSDPAKSNLVDRGTATQYEIGKSGTDKGELQFPDEAALFLGGRAGEHLGFMLEFNLGVPEGAAFASFKVPVGVWSSDDKHVEIIPFLTDAAGAPFATEVLNTGAVRPIRTWEARKAISAQQYVLTKNAVKDADNAAIEAAEGLALAYYSDIFHASATLFTPTWGAVDTGTDLSQYFRAVVTPNVGGWDLAAGVQLWTGKTKTGDTNIGYVKVDDTTTGGSNEEVLAGNEVETNAMAIDGQAQGLVGNMPLGVYASYAVAPKSSATGSRNFFNTANGATDGDVTAIAVSAELGVLPNKVTVGTGYRMGDNGKSTKSEDNALMFGAKYMLATNSQLQLNYEMYSGSAVTDGKKEDMTTLMLFSAF